MTIYLTLGFIFGLIRVGVWLALPDPRGETPAWEYFVAPLFMLVLMTFLWPILLPYYLVTWLRDRVHRGAPMHPNRALSADTESAAVNAGKVVGGFLGVLTVLLIKLMKVAMFLIAVLAVWYFVEDPLRQQNKIPAKRGAPPVAQRTPGHSPSKQIEDPDLERVIVFLDSKFKALDPNSNQYNQATVDRVMALQQAYRRKGYRPAEALIEAASILTASIQNATERQLFQLELTSLRIELMR